MENKQQMIGHERALAALEAIDLQYSDVPNYELVARYIKQQPVGTVGSPGRVPMVDAPVGTVGSPGRVPMVDAPVGRWQPPVEKALDIPSGLIGAVNNLYSFHDKFEVPWITDEPTWPGKARMDLRRKLVHEECFVELGDALARLEGFIGEQFGRGEVHVTQSTFGCSTDKQSALPEFKQRMANVAKEIVDSIYVLVGMGGEMGLDLSEVWKRVHASNLSKDGEKRADGKQLKGPGYVPADVEGAIFK